MDEMLRDAWDQFIGRAGGPLHFRFLVQPIVASIIGIREGLDDARAHRPAFLWTFITQPEKRGRLVRSAMKSLGLLFLMAAALDCVNQAMVLGEIHLLRALAVACVLAALPYAVIREVVKRVASHKK